VAIGSRAGTDGHQERRSGDESFAKREDRSDQKTQPNPTAPGRSVPPT
jgi:hypothetical protein